MHGGGSQGRLPLQNNIGRFCFIKPHVEGAPSPLASPCFKFLEQMENEKAATLYSHETVPKAGLSAGEGLQSFWCFSALSVIFYENPDGNGPL